MGQREVSQALQDSRWLKVSENPVTFQTLVLCVGQRLLEQAARHTEAEVCCLAPLSSLLTIPTQFLVTTKFRPMEDSGMRWCRIWTSRP